MKHCLHDNGSKMRLLIAVVMPDHVHLVFIPLPRAAVPHEPTQPKAAVPHDQVQVYSFEEILGGIKGASAHSINKALKRSGRVWQHESFDHVVRCAEKLDDKIRYVRENPVRKGLVTRAEDYKWLWQEPCGTGALAGERPAQPGTAVPHKPGVEEESFKARSHAAGTPRAKRFHVHAVPERAQFEIKFPRVERYTQAIRNRVTVDWAHVPMTVLQPDSIPPEYEEKGLSVNAAGRLSLTGPNKISRRSLDEYRAKHRLQEIVFDLASGLTKHYVKQPKCQAPAHVLFPQIVRIVDRYLEDHVEVRTPADLKDVGLSPYYGWVVEKLTESIRPDTGGGEAPEIPLYETSRGPGSTADVDLWTSREPRQVLRSHLNYVVPDTTKWEQQAAYYIDTHPLVDAFEKNAGLGFAIPYFHNGQMHDYMPDFIVRLKGDPAMHLIVETKGYDPVADVKKAAAERWVAAVNAEGSYGRWSYELTNKTSEIPALITRAAAGFAAAART